MTDIVTSVADDRAVVPPATIGMLGGGQLGRYALMAAAAMGYRTVVLDPDAGAPAGVVANEHLVAPYDDADAVARLGDVADVVTTEFENPPATTLDELAAMTSVAPNPRAVRIAQDRIAEKRFLVEAGVPVGPHLAVPADLDPDPDPLDQVIGDGAIVKTARLGYDGKGQRTVRDVAEFVDARSDLGGVDVIVETKLALLAEVSVLVGRSVTGETVTWPPAENEHVDGILDVSVVPATIDADLADRAVEIATTIAIDLEYVGVLAVEMFVIEGDGGPTLLVNELAPRPHNSGHWTIDAATTSQFAQQIRAVAGLGLGSTDLAAPAAAMVNLLGDLWFDQAGERRDPVWEAAMAHPDARLHPYGKAEPRPGRKMGHLTVTASSPSAARELALELRAALTA